MGVYSPIENVDILTPNRIQQLIPAKYNTVTTGQVVRILNSFGTQARFFFYYLNKRISEQKD